MRKIQKKILAVLLALTICVSTTNLNVFAMENYNRDVISSAKSVSEGNGWNENSQADYWDGETRQSVYESDGYRITFDLTGYWAEGYNANIKIENIGKNTIQNWYLRFDYHNTITNIWNAEISTNSENKYIIKNAGWNQDIVPGDYVTFGFSGNESFKGFPNKYELPGTSAVLGQDDYSIEYHLDSDWDSGFCGSITITNHTNEVLEDWVLEFDFDREITGIWDSVIEA